MNPSDIVLIAALVGLVLLLLSMVVAKDGHSVFWPLIWLAATVYYTVRPQKPYVPDFDFPPPGWTVDDDMITIDPRDSPLLSRALHDGDGWTVSVVRNVGGPEVHVCTKAQHDGLVGK